MNLLKRAFDQVKSIASDTKKVATGRQKKRSFLKNLIVKSTKATVYVAASAIKNTTKKIKEVCVYPEPKQPEKPIVKTQSKSQKPKSDYERLQASSQFQKGKKRASQRRHNTLVAAKETQKRRLAKEKIRQDSPREHIEAKRIVRRYQRGVYNFTV